MALGVRTHSSRGPTAVSQPSWQEAEIQALEPEMAESSVVGSTFDFSERTRGCRGGMPRRFVHKTALRAVMIICIIVYITRAINIMLCVCGFHIKLNWTDILFQTDETDCSQL